MYPLYTNFFFEFNSDAPPAYTPVASSSYNPPSAPPLVINQQPSYVSSGSGSNVRYENRASRGPIGSILDLAATSVVKATSNTASQTTNGPARTALSIVEGLAAARLDKRDRKEKKKEMKHERKEVKREMKQERKVLRKALSNHDSVIVVTPQYPTN